MVDQRLLAVIGVIAILFLASCRSGDVFSKNAPPGSTEASSSENATVDDRTAEARENVEETQAETQEELPPIPEIENITEVKSYDVKDKCTQDKLGVVRVFDDTGKKRVFRPFCDGESVVTFSCLEGIARPTSKNCANGCWISTTKGVGECREKALPAHRVKPTPTAE